MRKTGKNITGSDTGSVPWFILENEKYFDRY